MRCKQCSKLLPSCCCDDGNEGLCPIVVLIILWFAVPASGAMWLQQKVSLGELLLLWLLGSAGVTYLLSLGDTFINKIIERDKKNRRIKRHSRKKRIKSNTT